MLHVYKVTTAYVRIEYYQDKNQSPDKEDVPLVQNPSSFFKTYIAGSLRNCLFVTVSLSNNKIWFGWEWDVSLD